MSDNIIVAPPTRMAAAGMPESVNPDRRTLRLTLTTTGRDRQGDVVDPRGLDFASYLKNPVLLWAHDLSRPPVGKVLSLEVTDDAVTAEVQFADTPFAREVFDLYAGGFLHAWSIGFIPRRWEQLPADDSDARGFHVQEAEVVEISAVPVPANPDALTHALKTVKSASLRHALGGRELASPVRTKSLTFSQLATLAASVVDTLTEASVRKAVHLARGAV